MNEICEDCCTMPNRITECIRCATQEKLNSSSERRAHNNSKNFMSINHWSE